MAFPLAPYRGLFIFSPLTHGSRRGLYSSPLRDLATRKIVAPFSRKESSSDQAAAGTRCRFCGSKLVLKRRAVFGTHLGRWEPGGSSTDLAHITTLLGSFKIWRFRVCATTFVLRDNNWSRACSASRGLRAAPTHDYSDTVDSFLPLR